MLAKSGASQGRQSAKPRRFLAPKMSSARWQLLPPLPGLGNVAVAARAGSVGGSVGPRWGWGWGCASLCGVGGSIRRPSAPGSLPAGQPGGALGGAGRKGQPSPAGSAPLHGTGLSRQAALAPQTSSNIQSHLWRCPAAV